MNLLKKARCCALLSKAVFTNFFGPSYLDCLLFSSNKAKNLKMLCHIKEGQILFIKG